jgi:hypothetical protein
VSRNVAWRLASRPDKDEPKKGKTAGKKKPAQRIGREGRGDDNRRVR